MTTQLPDTSEANHSTLYDQDYCLWIETIANQLREKKFSEVDWTNLIEEIEDMGKSQKQALKSNLRVVLMHLLNYKYQPEKRSNSWLYTIFEHRERILESIEDSPSLKSYLQKVFDDCYTKARKEASLETGLPLDTFSPASPFTSAETLNPDYLPD